MLRKLLSSLEVLEEKKKVEMGSTIKSAFYRIEKRYFLDPESERFPHLQ